MSCESLPAKPLNWQSPRDGDNRSWRQELALTLLENHSLWNRHSLEGVIQNPLGGLHHAEDLTADCTLTVKSQEERDILSGSNFTCKETRNHHPDMVTATVFAVTWNSKVAQPELTGMPVCSYIETHIDVLWYWCIMMIEKWAHKRIMWDTERFRVYPD